QTTHRNVSTTGLAPRSADTLGGLVLGAQIVYDVDGDGNFVTLSSDPNTADQDYRVLLYVGSVTPDPEVACRAGNINTGVGPQTDTLFLNNSAGSIPERIVNVTPTTPFNLHVAATPSNGRKYAMYVWVNAPTASTIRTLPMGVGTICRVTPLNG